MLYLFICLSFLPSLLLFFLFVHAIFFTHFKYSSKLFHFLFTNWLYLVILKNNLYLAQKYVLGIFVCRHYLFQEQFFGEWNSRKTVSSEKQMMSKDKINNMHIFSCNIEAIVFVILWIFCKLCGKVFMNSLLYTAWDVFFFYCTLIRLNEQKEDFLSVTSTKLSLIFY